MGWKTKTLSEKREGDYKIKIQTSSLKTSLRSKTIFVLYNILKKNCQCRADHPMNLAYGLGSAPPIKSETAIVPCKTEGTDKVRSQLKQDENPPSGVPS